MYEVFPELSICQARGGETPHDAGFALVIVLLLMVALSMVGIAFATRRVDVTRKMAAAICIVRLHLPEAEAALRSTVARVDSKIGLTVETPVAPDSSDLNWKPLIQNGTDLSYLERFVGVDKHGDSQRCFHNGNGIITECDDGNAYVGQSIADLARTKWDSPHAK